MVEWQYVRRGTNWIDFFQYVSYWKATINLYYKGVEGYLVSTILFDFYKLSTNFND